MKANAGEIVIRDAGEAGPYRRVRPSERSEGGENNVPHPASGMASLPILFTLIFIYHANKSLPLLGRRARRWRWRQRRAEQQRRRGQLRRGQLLRLAALFRFRTYTTTTPAPHHSDTLEPDEGKTDHHISPNVAFAQTLLSGIDHRGFYPETLAR